MPKLKYKYDWERIRAAARSQHQIDTKMGSVEEAIQNAVNQGVMKDPYEKYRQLEEKNTEDTTLHASRGKKLQMSERRNVLEIDVGGSGYVSPQANHANLGGKDNIVKDGMKITFDEIEKNKKWTIHWWNRVKWFQKLPGFLRPESEENIRKHNEIIDTYRETPWGQKRKGNQKSKAEFIFEERYGINSTLPSLKDKKLIRVKENDPLIGKDGMSVRRVRYNMPGPQGTFLGMKAGISNRGDYSIHNLSNYMLDAGKDFLEPIFKEWKELDDDPKKIHPVTVAMKGHSRGGVAVSHGAMKVQNWIKENYPDYAKYVKFETIQLDPVAGYGSDHGVKRNINLTEEKREDLQGEMKKRGMSSLGESANTTVIYSLHTEHDHYFSPQVVDGAKRVILTTGKHSVNLENVDDTQKTKFLNKSHRQGYMDVSTGEMYRNSGLSELPEGIYIADEKNRLIRIPSAEAGQKILQEVLKDTSGQEGRHNRINEVMENWFKDHSPEKEKGRSSVRERINMKELQDENVKEQTGRARSRSVSEPVRQNSKNKNGLEL